MLTVFSRAGRLQVQFHHQWTIVKGGTVSNLDDAGSMADCRQTLVGNLDRLGVLIYKIHPVEEFAIGKLTGKNRELTAQVRPLSIRGRFHFRSRHIHLIPACRDCFRGNCRGNG
jgi:hypothetical protein